MGKQITPRLLEEPVEECNRRRAQANERHMAAMLGARTTPNSGATPFGSQKGDYQDEFWMWEDKLTCAGRFSLARADLVKLCREAALAGKTPGIAVTIEGLPPQTESRWVAVPAHVWAELTGKGIGED